MTMNNNQGEQERKYKAADQKHKSTSDQKHNITHQSRADNWLTVEKATRQLSLGNEDEKSGSVVYEHYVQMNVSND